MEEKFIPTPEWAELFCKALNELDGYKKSGKGWVWPILFKAKDLPEDIREIYNSETIGWKLDLYNGTCRGMEWYNDASQAEAEYVITAAYKDWVSILEGKLNPTTALMRRKLKIEKGSYATVLRYPIAALYLVKAAKIAWEKTREK
ncbi:MAG: SCP2 sterol-binding domain-containing protein [Desulfurococcales archaeon]|nr:SCP2 sterol-binding domain-containing protein [Desulfurococcales archaeon]